MFVPRRPGRGFTLIELLMVVAIMAILGAIAAPRYANATASYRVEIAAKRIAADIALIQARARATNTTTSIVFTVASSTYTLPSEKSQRLSTATYAVDLTQSPYYARVQSADCGGDATLQFTGYGLPDSGGQVVVTCGAWTRTISIDATSGAVTIQ